MPLVYGPWSNLDNPVLGKLRNHEMRWKDMNAVFVIDAILGILRFIHGENPPLNAPMIKTQHFNTIQSLQPKPTRNSYQKHLKLQFCKGFNNLLLG